MTYSVSLWMKRVCGCAGRWGNTHQLQLKCPLNRTFFFTLEANTKYYVKKKTLFKGKKFTKFFFLEEIAPNNIYIALRRHKQNYPVLVTKNFENDTAGRLFFL